MAEGFPQCICGAVFPKTKENQHYCSKACRRSGLAIRKLDRQRRWRAKAYLPEAKAEIERLRACLRVILDCQDPKCGSLCGACLASLQAIEPWIEKPVFVAADDPIRRFR